MVGSGSSHADAGVVHNVALALHGHRQPSEVGHADSALQIEFLGGQVKRGHGQVATAHCQVRLVGVGGWQGEVGATQEPAGLERVQLVIEKLQRLATSDAADSAGRGKGGGVATR